ncbi:transcriptional regulator protein Pur-beta-like [Clavelina lepadiformis]|uniref:Pur-alpha n=1 Tax=Clavelina lepadiformis TaxID=159417 RepID=A0ABP0FWT0_CLALP
MAERDSNGEQEAGGSRSYRSPQQMDTEELASKMVYIQNKRFYLDVKQNSRGRFIKIAEVTPGGHKNRLTLSMSIAHEFRNILGDFIEHYSTLGPTNPDEPPPEDRRASLKTERITRDNKRYFLDLKENQRGRFLRVRQQQAFSQYNQDGRPMNPPQIALPAQGMVEFRDALTGLIDEFGQEALDQPELPPPHVIGNRRPKQFFLDVGQNQRGVFLRVTEQTRFYRSAVTIPENLWEEFAEYLKTTSDQMDDYYEQLGKEKPKLDVKSPNAEGHGEEEFAVERRRADDYDDRAEEETKQE